MSKKKFVDITKNLKEMRNSFKSDIWTFDKVQTKPS